MSEKDKALLEKLSEGFQRLDPKQKEYFHGLADGMALAQQQAAEKPEAENADKP